MKLPKLYPILQSLEYTNMNFIGSFAQFQKLTLIGVEFVEASNAF